MRTALDDDVPHVAAAVAREGTRAGSSRPAARPSAVKFQGAEATAIRARLSSVESAA